MGRLGENPKSLATKIASARQATKTSVVSACQTLGNMLRQRLWRIVQMMLCELAAAAKPLLPLLLLPLQLRGQLHHMLKVLRFQVVKGCRTWQHQTSSCEEPLVEALVAWRMVGWNKACCSDTVGVEQPLLVCCWQAAFPSLVSVPQTLRLPAPETATTHEASQGPVPSFGALG
jgi:hypothetical protein